MEDKYRKALLRLRKEELINFIDDIISDYTEMYNSNSGWTEEERDAFYIGCSDRIISSRKYKTN
jgi:hypothetical protein